MSTLKSTSSASERSTSAVVAKGVGKAYEIYDKPIHRLYDLVLPGGPRCRHFWAVRNVYLDVPHGSTVGIVGENGAGKSTLLKLLTGVTQPTTGTVQTSGRVASLLELGAGFHPEFTGRENIFLNCSILGMSEEEIEERFESIVAFSELGDFIDRPVKTYSSGMYVRLGFSVASSVDPDILLIDEALSVGDEHFKGKCINWLNGFREEGKTTIFVSHDLGAIKSMCQHVVMMDRGEVIEQGDAEKVSDAYLKRVKARGNERLSMMNRGETEYPRWGTGEIEITAIGMFDADGESSHVFETGRSFAVRLEYKVLKDTKRPVFGLGIYRSDGTYVNGSNHQWRHDPIEIEHLAAGEEGTVEMSFESMPLLGGQYYLTTFLYDHSKASPTAIDHREHAITFEVVDGAHHQHGILYLPTRWRMERRSGDGEVSNTESIS
jgi:ABC-type polysaccharide/polyol phosphate transport system ATPase subunit